MRWQAALGGGGAGGWGYFVNLWVVHGVLLRH